MFFLGDDSLVTFFNSDAWIIFSYFLFTPPFNISAAAVWKNTFGLWW